jgi:large subunit ribosomal protein L9
MSKELEILLIKDVKGLGKFGQTKKVRMGFARNYLLPYEHAILASSANTSRFTALKKREEKRVVQERELSEKLKAIVEGKSIEISAKAQSSGVLYGSVTKKEMIASIKSTFEVGLSADQMSIQDHIKETGDYSFTVTFPQDIVATMSLKVIAKAEK